MTLDQIGIHHDTDKSSTHHDYLKVYESYFEPLKHDPITLVELGYGGYQNPNAGGAGARTWLDYFSEAQIISVDIHEKKNLPQDPRFKMIYKSQTDLDLKSLIGEPTVIIDDGSHRNDHVIESFKNLFPILKKGGFYIIEDTETAYSSANWALGTDDPTDLHYPTSINFCRKLINDVNAKYIGNYQQRYKIEFVHFYQNIIFIKKC